MTPMWPFRSPESRQLKFRASDRAKSAYETVILSSSCVVQGSVLLVNLFCLVGSVGPNFTGSPFEHLRACHIVHGMPWMCPFTSVEGPIPSPAKHTSFVSFLDAQYFPLVVCRFDMMRSYQTCVLRCCRNAMQNIWSTYYICVYNYIWPGPYIVMYINI